MTLDQQAAIRARLDKRYSVGGCFIDAIQDDLRALLDEVERLTTEQDAVHRQGMDRMQQAIIDLLNEHNAPLHLIARIVEMEYP